MARGVRNQLAVYLADLFAVAGTALAIPDGLALFRGVSVGRGPVVADLILVGAGLIAHRIAVAAPREAPAIALTCLTLGSLAVVWLTERWWVPTAAGAAAAAVAPQFLVSRRAVVWGAAGALLGLSGIVAGVTTALVASASIAAVGVVSFRLATQLRGAASRTAVDLERMLETERMQTAEVLARLNRLESRGRAGSRRSVLRTALSRRLSVVQAISQTIARDLRQALSGEQSVEIEAAARRNAERAQQLAQLAAGGEARERETTLSLVWPRVRDNLRSDVAPGFHFDVSLPEGLPPVAGGTEEWAQVLAAVVENALEAMPAGGVVRVHAVASERPGHACITIEDSGQGIPPEVLPHVLEPFYTSRAERGAEGLGLAMVASLVEALDGEVRVMSAPGSGTKVEIEVPFYAAAVRPTTAEQFRLEGTVLLADDDREIRESLGRLLESFGLETLEVDSGTVALAHLNARPDRFRAAILDVVMPGTPVSDIVVEARERQPGFPFLLISGLATARLVDNLLALGGVRFLEKPFTREELFYALRDLLTVERPAVV